MFVVVLKIYMYYYKIIMKWWLYETSTSMKTLIYTTQMPDYCTNFYHLVVFFQNVEFGWF